VVESCVVVKLSALTLTDDLRTKPPPSKLRFRRRATVSSVVQGTGMEGVANSFGSTVDQSTEFIRKAQMLYDMFTK